MVALHQMQYFLVALVSSCSSCDAESAEVLRRSAQYCLNGVGQNMGLSRVPSFYFPYRQVSAMRTDHSCVKEERDGLASHNILAGNHPSGQGFGSFRSFLPQHTLNKDDWFWFACFSILYRVTKGRRSAEGNIDKERAPF